MKQAWLLHGTSGSDTDYFWFEDLKGFLKAKGYAVWWPALPDTEDPELVESLEFVSTNKPGSVKDTLIIGHSSACPLILGLLQQTKEKAAKVILVAGFYREIDNEGKSKRMLPAQGFDWGLLQDLAEEIILINSDNDPWGCDDSQAREAAIQLGAKLIVNTGEGHMGSGSFNQPYREFTLLKRLLN